MNPGQGFADIPVDEDTDFKCMQAVFYEEAERLAEKLRFSEERGPGSKTEKKLKH